MRYAVVQLESQFRELWEGEGKGLAEVDGPEPVPGCWPSGMIYSLHCYIFSSTLLMRIRWWRWLAWLVETRHPSVSCITNQRKNATQLPLLLDLEHPPLPFCDDDDDHDNAIIIRIPQGKLNDMLYHHHCYPIPITFNSLPYPYLTGRKTIRWCHI